MRIVGKWLLGLLLVTLVVLGVFWGVMVRFEVESEYEEDFQISSLIGNLFLIKSGQWLEVQEVKVLLTPEEQDLFLDYEVKSNIILSSVNAKKPGKILI